MWSASETGWWQDLPVRTLGGHEKGGGCRASLSPNLVALSAPSRDGPETLRRNGSVHSSACLRCAYSVHRELLRCRATIRRNRPGELARAECHDPTAAPDCIVFAVAPSSPSVVIVSCPSAFQTSVLTEQASTVAPTSDLLDIDRPGLPYLGSRSAHLSVGPTERTQQQLQRLRWSR
ncbi:hypothetical protein MRX96_019660 [Rhipicephalus microplus]